VDYRKIHFDAQRVTLAPGMKLTFNGIAQGYAADRVLAALQANGIRHALVDTGEFRADGRKADGTPFRIGIQHPRQPDAFVALCALDGRALATSGDYATYFSDDFVYNHIFDPKTGRSPLEFSSVSVAAPKGIVADGLSTALFVLGRERALALLERLPDCDAYFVAKSGHTFKTKNFPEIAG
jgi:thiamine biosynthesis lipoprotein